MSNSTPFEGFCGGTFWDTELTWGGNAPRFTECFQQSVLVWVPCGFLWLALIPYAAYLSSASGTKISTSKLNVAKTVFGLALILVSLVDLIQGSVAYSQRKEFAIYFVSPFALTVTFILAFVLFRIEKKKGLITSGVLFLFHLFLTICGIVPFYMKILDKQEQGYIEDTFRFVTFYTYYGLLLVQTILFCFAERSEEDIYFNESGKAVCPEVFSSFLSRITFWWINSLVLTGYKKTLTEDDLWSPNPRDLTRNNAPKFISTWDNDVAKYRDQERRKQLVSKQQVSGGKSPAGQNDLLSETTPLLSEPSGEASKVKSEEKKGSPSLAWVIAKVFGPMLVVAHACKLVCDILTFVGPILQGYLIQYTEDPFMQEWKGYLYASLFFITSVVNSFFFHQLFHIGMTLGMRVKASLIAAIYQKALTMSNEARKTTTVGEIVNLMSVDAQRMQDLFGYLWMFWSCPVQIILAIYLLWQQLGPSVLAGLGLMILLIPINGVIGTIQRRLQTAQMGQKDQRIKLMNEVLNGIKVLKLYAWELSFKDKINAIRHAELDTLQKYAYLQAVSSFTWTCAPFMVTLVCFLTFTLTGGVLDANKAFVSLSLLNILRFPINLLPMMITYMVTAVVSIKRISAFLMNRDLDFDNVQHNPMAEHPITIRNGEFSWGTTKDDFPILKNVNVDIAEGKLIAVVGSVGAGKSSLLSAILGEMEKLKGQVNVRGSVAYVAQQAWIQNATLRNNILFGSEYDEQKYDSVLEACALKPDLEILTAGDMTEIGEKGINLSGGQKQRVSLARAVYSDADIYLLDDPLSAVDSHVGKHIFEQVCSNTGALKGKTRVLVTHGVHWLPKVDKIIVITNGEISETGSYDELMSHDGAFAQFLKTHLTQEESDSEEEEDEEIKQEKRRMLDRVTSIASDDKVVKAASPTPASTTSEKGSENESAKVRSRRKKTKSGMSESKVLSQISRQKSKKEEELKKEQPGNKLIEAEKSEEGKVRWSVFFAYIKALGVMYAVLWVVFFIAFQVASVLSSIWLSVWTEDPLIANSSLVNTSQYTQKRNMYLGVYGGLGAGQALFVLFYAMITAVSMVRAARLLHENMLYNILKSPMSFFDTTPIGRILNRFSRDIETIDNLLPALIRSWINTFFGVISTIVVISYSTPIFLSVVVPLAILYYFIQRFYIPTSRQLKRIESTTRSPIYVHFSETVTGVSTIRAYGVQKRFLGQSEKLVDHNLAFYFGGIASNRWLGFRLEFMGALIVLAAALFAVIGKNSLSGGLVGLSISYALQVTQALNWMVRMTSDLETNVVSVERVKEYSETPTEADWYIETSRPPRDWPDEGKVAFESYSTRYRPGLDLVLRGITADIRGQEKIGIVGRTGAGKSSLTVAMFRLIEAAGGSIQIDGIPISILGLHQLRSKLTILPQDPVLFSGSLRMNLDPFDKYSDNALWNALEHAHLKDFVQSLPALLEYECGEGGQNLSVGQRQLVCLARTLLRKTKILILDEATAAVDLETDRLIQETIRKEFADCTILTIAHRLKTIMDSDRVMVLDNGKIAEFDSPSELLAKKDSIFYAMCKDANIQTNGPNNGANDQ